MNDNTSLGSINPNDDLNDIHLELDGVGRRCMHQSKQRGKILVAAVAHNQLLYDGERHAPTHSILDHRLNTAGTATLTKHTYRQTDIHTNIGMNHSQSSTITLNIYTPNYTTNAIVYSAVVMARPLREFTQFTR